MGSVDGLHCECCDKFCDPGRYLAIVAQDRAIQDAKDLRTS